MDNREVKKVQSHQWEEGGCVLMSEIKPRVNKKKPPTGFAGFLGG